MTHEEMEAALADAQGRIRQLERELEAKDNV